MTKTAKRPSVLRLATGTAALAALAAALGWASSAEAATKLRVMYQGAPVWQAEYNEIAKRFEAANPDVDVELIVAPHDAYNEKVGAAVMAKDLPDVMHIDGPFLANYAWSGILQPVAPYVDKAVLDDMTGSNKAQGTYPIDGKLYAVGLMDSTVALFGNKRYLQAIGARIPTSVEDAWTRAEFEDALQKLSKLEGVKWPLDTFRGSGVKTEWVTYAYSPIFQSMGCDLIDRKTWKASGTLDSKPCVEAATMMQGWVGKGWVVPQSAGTNQFYTQGNPAALAIGGHWVYGDASKNMGADNVVVMPLPKFGAKGVSPSGTWIWGITKATKNPELAGRFISFLVRDAGYQRVARERTGFPGLKSFAESSPTYAKGGPMAVAFEQADKTALPRPPHPAYPTITLAFMEAMDAILNKADPAATLKRAAQRIDGDIDDNDGYPPFNKMSAAR